ALGALIASHAGAINMALEGIMLTASLLAVMFSAWLQNCWAGLLGAVLGGLLMSLLFAWLHLYKDSDLIITGLALNTMASGGTVYLLYLVCCYKGTSRLLPSINLPNVELPLIRHIPVLGPVLSGHNILTYLALVAVFLCWVLVFRSRLGLRIRAVGFNPNAAASVGISVRRVKFEALLLSGLFASLGGAFMSMGYLSYFARDMMAGRGYIGIAAATLADGHCLSTLLASLGFGTANAASITLATMNLKADLVAMIPYLVTVIGLVIVSARKQAKARKLQADK
uniref:ABC transporter permease n=1 Tax=Faecalibacterium sp. TaxID=1971605 RepID=UPI003FEDAEA4